MVTPTWLESFTARALLTPRPYRGAWLLDLECDLTAAGKDGFLVAMAVGDRLAILDGPREQST